MDRITNPKDSNVCKTTGNNDNTTPTGSYYPDSCFCYKYAIPSELADISLQNLCFKHLIPSEFNFDNLNSCYTNKTTNPEDSYIYKTMGYNDNPTPTGSDVPDSCFCYKYAIPSEFNFGNPKFYFIDKITNPEDSYIYKTMGYNDNPTPTGSNILGLNLCYKHAIPLELADVPVSCFCYKYAIPSEFNFDNLNSCYTNKTTNPEDSYIYKTMGYNDNPTPMGSDVPGSCFCYKHAIPLELADVPRSCFCYKHSIPSELADVPESCLCYKHVIPSELLDITVQNIYFKHVIHSEFNFDNPKFYFTNGIANPEDSNVYKTTGYKDKTTSNNDNSTPSGSNAPDSCFCYKYAIPSEFNFGNPKFYFIDKITNPEDSYIYKTMGYNDNPTPTGSDVPDSCFCYKYAIHSEFNFGNPKFYFTNKTTNPEDSYIYKTTDNNDNSTPTGSNIPTELVDISLPNLHSKHAIPMGLLNNKLKSKC